MNNKTAGPMISLTIMQQTFAVIKKKTFSTMKVLNILSFD